MEADLIRKLYLSQTDLNLSAIKNQGVQENVVS